MTITASEFKAKCLRLMEHVRDTGESISITKRGVEVAQLTPPERREKPWERLRGTAIIVGDIVSSPFKDEDFDAFTGRELMHGMPAVKKQPARKRVRLRAKR
jgi:prevent-host-death family protein